MTQERRRESNPYEVAEVIFNTRIEQLQQEGWLRRPSQIADDWELDNHFDDLTQVYRQVCLEMGLPWPPMPIEL